MDHRDSTDSDSVLKELYERQELQAKKLTITFADSGLLLFPKEKVWEDENLAYIFLHDSPNPILIADPDTTIMFVNSALEELTGFKSEELIGEKMPYPWITRLDSNTSSENLIVVTKTEELFQSKDGRIFWVENTIAPVKVRGTIRYYIQIWIDVTARKLAETALADERERMLVTLQSIGDAVIATDTNGQIILANKASEELFGQKLNKIIGNKLSDVVNIVSEKTMSKIDDPAQAMISSHEPFEPNHDFIVSGRFVSIKGNPVVDGSGRLVGTVLVLRDITEKRELQEETLKMQKLELVGILAGKLAHDFNNILTAIMGNISLAKMYDGQDAWERLNAAEEACVKARDLIRQMLIFSKGGAPIKKASKTSEFIRESVIFALKGSNVICDFEVPDDLWTINIDEGMMNQVINNIVLNACNSMPEGGTIKVQGQNVALDANSNLPLEGNFVKISIQDFGKGIPKDELDRIFEPYFLSHDYSGANGLNLSASYAIVRKHDGYMTVESSLGKGTTFHIYLPVSDQKYAKPIHSAYHIKGSGRVLLMDDEGYIRDLASRMIRNIGYEVTTAENGDEAIQIYINALNEGKRFDAVILDLTVPGGMGGKEVVKRLLEIDKNLKAIVSSGYSNDPVMANFKDYGFKGVVAKPYRMTELSNVLYEVISNSEGIEN